MKFFMNLSIKVKFLILIAVSSILPIAILGAYAYNTSVRSVTEQASSRSVTALNRLSAFIDMDLQEINDFTAYIASDTIVLNALAQVESDSGKYADVKAAVFNEIYHPANPISVTTNLIVIASTGQYFTDINYEKNKIDAGVEKIIEESWFRLKNRYYGSVAFVGLKKGYIDGFGTDYHYYLYKNILDKQGNYLGTMVVDISSYIFDRLLSSIITNDSDVIYLLDGEQNILSVSVTERSATGNFRDLKGLEKNYIIEKTKLINENWSLVYLISKSNISKSINSIILFTFGIIALLLLFALFVYAFIHYSVTRPIVRLSDAMAQVQQGNFDLHFQAITGDEIGALTNGFNGMLVDIKEYIQKVKQEERQAREFELKMLQAQINPHFMYNSLNSIKWMADLMGCSNISHAIFHMIKLLQYSVDEIGATISLKDEIEYIKGYVFLNNLRYKDKFRLDIQLSPKFENVMIPKFFLQPLVENSIQHGLREKPGVGIIELLIDEESDGVLSMSVTDDGVGFDRGKDFLRGSPCDKMNEKPFHIGLRNVDRRLKLLYGEECGLVMSSEPGCGATVSMSIPMNRGLSTHENTNCG
jgi:two-component system, sensor histidine kinase YesM